MNKIIELNELLVTDSYKKDGLHFPHPNDLKRFFIDPILHRFPDTTFQITVDKEGGAGTSDDGDITTWGRGLIQAHIQSLGGEELELNYTIGIIWSYDTSKRVIKLFRGVNTWACTNLCIGGADDIYEINLGGKPKGTTEKEIDKLWRRKKEDVFELLDEKLTSYLDSAVDSYKEIIRLTQSLKNTWFDESGVAILIGNMYLDWVITGHLDYSTFNFAFQVMFDTKFMHPNKHLYALEERKFSLWHLYSAMTQRISDDKTAIDLIPNKVLDITNVLTQYIPDTGDE